MVTWLHAWVEHHGGRSLWWRSFLISCWQEAKRGGRWGGVREEGGRGEGERVQRITWMPFLRCHNARSLFTGLPCYAKLVGHLVVPGTIMSLSPQRWDSDSHFWAWLCFPHECSGLNSGPHTCAQLLYRLRHCSSPRLY